MIVCPSCGQENQGANAQCYNCSAELSPPAFPTSEPLTLPLHTKVGKMFKFGRELVATALADGSIKVILSARMYWVNSWFVMLLYAIGGVAFVDVAAFAKYGAILILVAAAVIDVAKGSQGGTVGPYWIASHGCLKFRKRFFGRWNVTKITTGRLILATVDRRRIFGERGVGLVIEDDGASETVCQTVGVESLKTLGRIIAHETGFDFDEREPR